MQELLIVNPSARPSKRKKAPSAAQKRARAKFAAMARARAGKKRKSTTLTVMSNPKKRRTKRRNNPIARVKRRRNPIGVTVKKPLALLQPALMGALGAVAVNTILSKLPIPVSATTGKMKYVTQAAAAIGLAVIAQKVGVKGALAAQMAEGSLTVTLHQAITDIAAGAGMNLSGMGYYLPGRAVKSVPSPSANSAPMAMRGMGKYLTGPGSPNHNVTQLRGIRQKSGFAF